MAAVHVETSLELLPDKISFPAFTTRLVFGELTINYSSQTEFKHETEGFGLKWIIFISFLLKKMFLFLRAPVAVLGWLVEMSLNYPLFNGGYLGLLFNLLTGRVVHPEKSSKRFTSIIGHLDKRSELDTNIGKCDIRYNASLAMMASKLSYENEAFVENVVTNNWKMEFLGFGDYRDDFGDVNCTQAFMCQDNSSNSNLIVVAFRGTELFNTNDWVSDIDLSWYEFRGIGEVHSGFMKALGLQNTKSWPKEIPPSTDGKIFAYYAIREKLRYLIRENKDAKFILTGHSLGGALAILFVTILAMHDEEDLLRKLEGVYTFGQPRVGNEQFGEYMKQKMRLYGVKYFRYVYCNDMVPRVPYDDRTFLFKHFGPCLHFNSFYKGQVLRAEPNKNYFSVFHVMPKILNAHYEVIRSFLLPWTRGKEYEEEWLMRMLRTAVLIPGLTNHMSVDYVNLTRLTKLPCHIYSEGPYLELKED